MAFCLPATVLHVAVFSVRCRDVTASPVAQQYNTTGLLCSTFDVPNVYFCSHSFNHCTAEVQCNLCASSCMHDGASHEHHRLVPLLPAPSHRQQASQQATPHTTSTDMSTGTSRIAYGVVAAASFLVLLAAADQHSSDSSINLPCFPFCDEDSSLSSDTSWSSSSPFGAGGCPGSEKDGASCACLGADSCKVQ
jgi:hypothetical protein